MSDTRIVSKIYPAKLLKPQIPCLNCLRSVSGFSGQSGDENSPEFGVLVYPCGCVVSKLWALTFIAEMENRGRGCKPGSVHDCYASEVAKRVTELEKSVTEIGSRRDAAVLIDDQSVIKTCKRELNRIKIALTQLMPGTRNLDAVSVQGRPAAVGPGDVFNILAADDRFSSYTAERLGVMSREVLRQLKAWVTQKAAVEPLVAEVFKTLVPTTCGAIPTYQPEPGAALDDSPEKAAAAVLRKRQRRRIDMRRDVPPKLEE